MQVQFFAPVSEGGGMKRSEEITKVIWAELARRKEAIDSDPTLRAVTFVVTFDQRRRSPARVIYRTESQSPINEPGT